LAKLVEERGGALSEQEAVGYILKVCEALDVVHKAGYLHRDIKPENIIVCEDGRVVLVDFGAARAYMAGKTGRMTVLLTLGFAPLEQYAEQAKRGAYTDIYALGATLYYLLTGQVPVSAADRFSGVELRGVREINGRVSRQVEEAVRKAMAMRVEERPQSVEEFVKLLTSPSVPSVVKGVWREVTSPPELPAPPDSNFSDLNFLTLSPRPVTSPPEPLVVKGVWREVATLRGHGDSVWSISFSPDGKFLASGSSDTTVKVWEVGSWREVATLRRHQGWVLSVSFSPDGKFLASGSYQTVKVWGVGSWREVATLRHGGDVSSVSFSPDGKFLASGSWDGTVKVWGVGSWREVAILRHGDSVSSVSFSPDGKFLASGSGDWTMNWTMKVWAVGSWREVATLRGHEGPVYSVSFSPDGKFLASGSRDTTVKVWEVGSWREVATLRGHQDWVLSVSFSPDGKFLASGSVDKTVKVWEVGG
jgi:WD40 repeat protein